MAKPKKIYFKILRATGESTYQNFTWPLPVNGKPGAWLTHDGAVIPCESGLHLATDPKAWFEPGCKIYVASVAGPVVAGDNAKIACAKARLVREATQADLEPFGIFFEGYHAIEGSCIAMGTASVEASGSASVRAYGSASVTASGSASVRAYGSASVEAYDSASVRAYGSASVTASGSASVTAYDSASVRAFDSASVTAYDSASVRAYDSASVRAYDSASVRAFGSASVTAYDSASVRAYGSAVVIVRYGSPVVTLDGGKAKMLDMR